MAIGVAALLALITASSVVDTIDRIPIVSTIIELIGIGVTGWCVPCHARGAASKPCMHHVALCCGAMHGM